MSLILGILDSGVAVSTNSYESIATVTVGSPVSAITFSSIPSTYTHLQIRILARSTVASSTDMIAIQLNNDGSSSYRSHFLGGNGSSASAASTGTQTYAELHYIPGSTASSNVFGSVVIDILDYVNTNKNKTIRALTGFDNNGNGDVQLNSALYISTSAVNRLDFYAGPGTNSFVQYTQFALYGIKGA
jgi:hypothetical protein